ncbi:hypothetical protein Q0Z83_059940 [Actinoplanes sichuanensis]|nr:hypothetical protein Q0Z83_059940 [Actinoplanes sichuanensis]
MRRTEKYGWIPDVDLNGRRSNDDMARDRQTAKLKEVKANEKNPKGSGRHSAR